VVEPVNAKRVVLAYSGGLDTSVAVRWIQEEWGAEVVAMAVDVGQVPDADAAYWDAVRARASAAGAIEALVVDAREEYAREYVARAIKANALYRASTRSSPRCRVRSSPGTSSPRRASTARTRSRTAAPARATTRSGSR